MRHKEHLASRDVVQRVVPGFRVPHAAPVRARMSVSVELPVTTARCVGFTDGGAAIEPAGACRVATGTSGGTESTDLHQGRLPRAMWHLVSPILFFGLTHVNILPNNNFEK